MKWPCLSREEEKELAIRWRREGDIPARNALAMSQHDWMCGVVWNRYRHLGVPREDLHGYGAVVLLEAAGSFDPAFGTGFRTWARGALLLNMPRKVLSHARLVKVPWRHSREVSFAVIHAADWADMPPVIDPASEVDPSRQDWILWVRDAVSGLPERERRLVEVRWLGEEGVVGPVAAGRILGVSKTTVSDHSRVVLARLHQRAEAAS